MSKKLPEGWKSLILEECLELIRNGCDVKQEDTGLHPITRIETISFAKIDLKRVKFCTPTQEQIEKYKLIDGDILFSHINSPTHIGKTAIYYKDLGTIIHGINLLLLRPNKRTIFPKYLDYYLKSNKVRTYFETRCKKSVNQASLNQKDIKTLEVILPPLEEQERIVSILEKAEKTIEKREESIKLLDELVKSRFIDMFGNFVYEKNKWNICEVGDVAEVIDPQPSHRTPPVSVDGIPYIGVADCNYKNRCVDFKNARKVGANVLEEHLNRYSISDGDFIIGKIGTIGRPFYIPTDQNYTLSANTVLIKSDCSKVSPQFLFTLFQSEYLDRLIDAEKQSTSQPALGIQKVRKIAMPLPPIELQSQFAQFAQQVDKLKFEMENSLKELENNFNSLMQKSFNGEL